MFSCEFCEISKNIFYYRTPLVAASTVFLFGRCMFLNSNDGQLFVGASNIACRFCSYFDYPQSQEESYTTQIFISTCCQIKSSLQISFYKPISKTFGDRCCSYIINISSLKIKPFHATGFFLYPSKH